MGDHSGGVGSGIRFCRYVNTWESGGQIRVYSNGGDRVCENSIGRIACGLLL